MKCKYCGKELPKVIEGHRDVCSCEKAQKEWSLEMEIQHLKKRLNELNKELKDLENCSLTRNSEGEGE